MAEITGVLLAAGNSSRFGDNKLLAPLNDKPLITYSAATLKPCDRVIAVVRAEDRELQTLLSELDVECLVNSEPERGIGFSIATAVKATGRSNGWCILPGDMPYISQDVTQQLIDALLTGACLAVPVYEEQRGHPVAFSAHLFDQLAELDGDVGARNILEKFADEITVINTQDAGVLVDIDSPSDLDDESSV